MHWIYKLHGHLKHYDWGDESAIPQFIGQQDESGRPVAEYWLGAHPQGSARVLVNGGELELLSLIRTIPQTWLGEPDSALAKDAAPSPTPSPAQFPYLVKLLSAKKALSIQLHPDKLEAEQGFQEENARSIALLDPQRSYKDASDKPELMIALTLFSGLCGFRPQEHCSRTLRELAALAPSELGRCLAELLVVVQEENWKEACRFVLERCGRQVLVELVQTVELRQKQSPPSVDQASFAALLSAFRDFGYDAGLWFFLFLRLIHLQPGQGLFIPAGVLHAYVKGFGIEVMANSDNVVRAGLTSKRIDIQSLLTLLKPQAQGLLYDPQTCQQRYCYEVPTSAFRVERFCAESNRLGVPLAKQPHASTLVFDLELSSCSEIYVCTQGRVVFSREGEASFELARGEAAIVLPKSGRLRLQLAGEVIRAWKP